MNSPLKALGPKTSGDVGVSAIALAVGYFADLALAAHFPHLGIPPGAASVYFSSFALGVKRSFDAINGPRAKQRQAALAKIQANVLNQRKADFIIETLLQCTKKHSSAHAALEAFRTDWAFYNQGFLTDSQLKTTFADALKTIRDGGCIGQP